MAVENLATEPGEAVQRRHGIFGMASGRAGQRSTLTISCSVAREISPCSAAVRYVVSAVNDGAPRADQQTAHPAESTSESLPAGEPVISRDSQHRIKLPRIRLNVSVDQRRIDDMSASVTCGSFGYELLLFQPYGNRADEPRTPDDLP